MQGSRKVHLQGRSPIGGLWVGLHNPSVALVIAALIWGIAAPVSKITLTEIGPFTLLFFRTVIASIVLLPSALRYRFTFTYREQVFLALSAILSIFVHLILFYMAIPLVPSIHAPIIASISPFILVLAGRIFLRERVSIRKYMGMGLGLVGIICITVLPSLFALYGDVLGLSSSALASLRMLGLGEARLGPGEIMWLGNTLLILSVVAGAVGPMFIKSIRHYPAHLITFWQFALVACFTLPFALLETPRLVISQLTPVGVSGILYIGILSSVVAYSLHTFGLQETKTADVGIFSYLSPVSALLVGIPLLHEYPDAWFIIGSAFVLGGLWIAERRSRPRPSRL